MSRYLKEKHSIDSVASSIAEKRIRDETVIDIIILRDIEVNRKAEDKRRKKIINVDLDKTTLKYLYLQ